MFVLRSEDSSRWWTDGDSNFNVPIPGGRFEPVEDPLAGFEDPISRTIIEGECFEETWSLALRYNVAAELLQHVVEVRAQINP